MVLFGSLSSTVTSSSVTLHDERGFLGGRDAVVGDFDIYVGHVELRCLGREVQYIFVTRADKVGYGDYT
ncbi:hypothetical protein LP419_01935 [Massilia sp. H-1]|nr:hypothetical protein LP419_01935 [Massilia sp. H-1]